MVLEGDVPLPDGTRDLGAMLDAPDDRYEIGPTDPEQTALLHFTSGATGRTARCTSTRRSSRIMRRHAWP
jgi:acyl-coenzyme A synthetase/AMP-(fatty) acid ligase